MITIPSGEIINVPTTTIIWLEQIIVTITCAVSTVYLQFVYMVMQWFLCKCVFVSNAPPLVVPAISLMGFKWMWLLWNVDIPYQATGEEGWLEVGWELAGNRLGSAILSSFIYSSRALNMICADRIAV